MKRYTAICWDEGNCEYAEIVVQASGFTHALQKIAAQLPDEEPDHISVYVEIVKKERA